MAFEDPTYTKRILGWISDLFQAEPHLDEIRSFIEGEPYVVPVRLYPFMSIFVGTRREDSNRGNTPATGPVTGYEYPAYLSIETLLNDAPAFKPGTSPANRLMEIPSHKLCDRLVWAAWETLVAATSPHQIIEGAIVSADGKERSQELVLGELKFGLQSRPDSVTNTGTLEFTITSRRQEY